MAILLLGCLCAISSAGEQLETRFGLPGLFGLRNVVAPPAVPEKLFIVTPYRTRTADQPSLLRNWDRRLHADAIRHLAYLDVSVLAIDIFFRDPHPGEDELLAKALRTVPNSLLVQNLRPFGSDLRAGILENPVSTIADAASGLALSQVAGTPVRNDTYALRAPVMLKHNADHCRSILSSQSPCPTGGESTPDATATDTWPASYEWTTSPTLPLAAFDRWSSLPVSNDDTMAVDSTMEAPQKVIPDKGISHILLNLYGPPQTIPTLDYKELEALVNEVDTGLRDNPLSDSVVFLGGSYSSLHSQREDGFNTVFSSNDRPMPGVEMAATAFSNLRDRNWLTPKIQPRDNLLFTLVMLGPLFLLSRPVHTRRSLLLAAFCGCGLLVFVSYQFTSEYVWLPFVTPLLALTLATAYIVLSDLRGSNRLKEQARGELGNFVSDLVLAQLDGGRPHQLEQAICLVSDVRGFTAMSERLTAQALHEYNERYFSILFDRVTSYGADVVKTYGDSMTAIWKGSDEQQRAQALRAAREILLQMNMNMGYTDGPQTHIGICSGPVVVGYVGVKQRRSVELTGGAVYRASRLEQLNKSQGTMMLSSQEFESHAREIGLHVVDIGLHHLRGFDTPTRVIAMNPATTEEIECAVS